jgi:hypothetical protein
MNKKEQKDIDKLENLYSIRKEKAKGGKRSCPYCKSRSWWQTASSGRQCNKCWQIF